MSARAPSAVVSPPNTAGETVVRGACPHDCPDTCALRVTVRDGRVVRVAGDPDHPATHGALCAKVSRYPERTYASDRLLRPLRRVGRKGEGRFEPMGWDEAIATIAERLRRIAGEDPQRILPYSYAGTMGLVQYDSMSARFFHRLGASRLDRTICASAGAAGLLHTLGGSVGMDVEAFADAGLILIWGSNSITSNLHFWSFAQQAKRRGARLVAIDPLRTDTAQKCHQHIALLPGTDGALALGLIHVLIDQGLLDRDYVERHTLGFDRLAARAAEYPPQRVAQICGISAQEIVDLARDYGTIRPAAIRLNYGMQRVRGGGNAVRLIAGLPALVGAWRDAAGGMLLSSSGHFGVDLAAIQRPDLMPGWPQRLPRIVNMSTIGDALLEAEPPIDALVVFNSNPVAVAPDSERVIRGFARDDLFTVVIEHFQTDTADFADIVLPATTQLEHFDIHKSYGHRYWLVNEPAVAPLGEARPNSEIFRLLAQAMGFDEPCFRESDAEIAAAAIRRDAPGLPAALREGEDPLAALRALGWAKLDLPAAPFADGGFPTASGKVEFASAQLEAQGLDPVPDYVPPYESRASAPELARRYPLAMISPPARNFLNSSFVNVESLRVGEPEPALQMNTEDAHARGIADGMRVRVFNDRGSLQACVRVGDRVRPGVVSGAGIWWHKLSPGGRNVNAVTSQSLTDLGRAPTFYDCLVEVALLS